MNLLFVSLNSPFNEGKKSTGGAEWSMRILGSQLSKMKHNVHYITSGELFDNDVIIDGIHVHKIWLAHIPLLHRLFPFINRINARLLVFFLKRKIRKTLKKNYIQLIHYYSPYPSGISCIQEISGKPIVTVQRIGGKFWERLGTEAEYNQFRMDSLSGTDIYISNCKYLAIEFNKYFLNNMGYKINVLVQEIGQIPFELPSIKFQKGKLVCVASLKDYQKRQDILLKTVQILKKRGRDIRLVLVGNGPNMDHLIKIANDLRIKDQVIFSGNTSMTKARTEMASAEVIVHAAEWEGVSKALLDAMLLSKPIVASKVGGIDEYIIDGKTGILSENDPVKFANAIERLLIDTELGKQLGRNALTLVRERYDPMKNSLEYERIFQEAIRKKNIRVGGVLPEKVR